METVRAVTVAVPALEVVDVDGEGLHGGAHALGGGLELVDADGGQQDGELLAAPAADGSS